MLSSTSFLNSLLSGLIVYGLFCCAAVAESALPGDERRIVVFPIENLSGAPAPLKELDAELAVLLKRTGVRIVDTATIESFINKHQVRYLGGIDEHIAGQLNAETGAESVLITSLELYNDVDPPKFSLISRLVSLNDIPEIVWMKSVGIAGDDAPGILGLGMINDIKELRGKGLESIAKSLVHYSKNAPTLKKRLITREREEYSFRLDGLSKEIRSEKERLASESKSNSDLIIEERLSATEDKLNIMNDKDSLFISRYDPVGWYSSSGILANQDRTIAIIPFFNRSTRKHAAELQVLHLAMQLVEKRVFRVLELGVIRDRMLNMHVIMSSGVSLPIVDLISISLGSDLLLNGVVFDYLDTVGYGSNPKVDFSMQIFNREDKKILWSSHSNNQGDDGVYFFDSGRITTAAALTDKMCRAFVQRLVENAGRN